MFGLGKTWDEDDSLESFNNKSEEGLFTGLSRFANYILDSLTDKPYYHDTMKKWLKDDSNYENFKKNKKKIENSAKEYFKKGMEDLLKHTNYIKKLKAVYEKDKDKYKDFDDFYEKTVKNPNKFDKLKSHPFCNIIIYFHDNEKNEIHMYCWVETPLEEKYRMIIYFDDKSFKIKKYDTAEEISPNSEMYATFENEIKDAEKKAKEKQNKK